MLSQPSHADPAASGSAARSIPPLRPEPVTLGEMRASFTRGRATPRGVVWFGLRSFWGHLRHFAAAAIATEDIDSRDWMTPDDPQWLVDQIAGWLGGTTGAPTLLEALGRDLWIDYVSDTGDDVSVSAAVAGLLAAEYEVPDPDRPGELLLAPRGELLIFGGDTAYPVATAQEINARVIVPFNRALLPRRDGKPRVLLGIPGNHDWYDGLDGFGRMFRRRDDGGESLRPSMLNVSRGMLDYYAEWAREFVRGGKVEKPKALVLADYMPVQNASYFVLPLTPGIHLFGVDRQLRNVDSHQRRFHAKWYRQHADAAAWVLMPDPLYRFGSPSRTGTDLVQGLGLDFHARPHFLLSGDVHHYERFTRDSLLHVIAGGGGAFLHPSPMFEGRLPADVRWPNSKQSRALLHLVPWKVARGRSGFLPHLALLVVFAPAMAFGIRHYERLGVILSMPVLITMVVGSIYTLIGGIRRAPRRVAVLGFSAGALTAAVPMLASRLLSLLAARLHYAPSVWALTAFSLVVAVFAGAWIFGAYLALLTRLGVEQTQAFTALDHPGFKHFLRLRVRADGKGVDGYCVGLQDPLRPGEKVVLVDRFSWRP